MDCYCYSVHLYYIARSLHWILNNTIASNTKTARRAVAMIATTGLQACYYYHYCYYYVATRSANIYATTIGLIRPSATVVAIIIALAAAMNREE